MLKVPEKFQNKINRTPRGNQYKPENKGEAGGEFLEVLPSYFDKRPLVCFELDPSDQTHRFFNKLSILCEKLKRPCLK
jgi:hypothetical protein